MRRFFLLSLITLASGLRAFAQQAVIWDDDCSSDVDCTYTSGAVWKLADQRYIKVLAVMADSANPQSIAVLHAVAAYYQHTNGIVFAANQTNAPATSYCTANFCNSASLPSSSSPWTGTVVAKFAPGDNRSKYADCVSAYRQVLSAQPAKSVIIVATGFATCLYPLMQSAADGNSPLTGAQLIQQKVSALSICCGVNPTGTEFNYASDSPNFSSLFAAWTTQNGYPPIWQTSFISGTTVHMGPAQSGNAAVNPVLFAQATAGPFQRGSWDAMTMLYAAWGMTNPTNSMILFSDAGDGTQTVNAATGVNTWSASPASGHHYLQNVATGAQIGQIFDGFSYAYGFLAQPPLASNGGHVPVEVSAGGAVQ